MTKRILILALVLLMLAGCTQTPPQETTAPGAPTVTQPQAPPETTYAPPPKTLTVHFIDVGQADCALLECDNAFALIDGGNADDSEKVIAYLESQGVQRLNLVVGTHPHEDHIGSLGAVLNAFPADNIWSGPLTFYNSVVDAFSYGAKKQGKSLFFPEPGQTFHLGGALITVLGPVRSYYEDANDLSLVLMVEYGNTRFLFTGDMELAAETDLLDSGADVKADVLKVGHHGSYSSTGYRLLREVAPTYAVISVGAGNDYGHPHTAPMSRLRDAEVIVYRTDKMYTITAVSDGENITFSWENPYAQPGIPYVP